MKFGARYVIRVRGIPAPQGSKRHVGGGRMVEQSRAVGPWRDAVRTETQRVVPDGGTLGGPVHVVAEFWLPRPKTLPKKYRLPTRRPDLDKLARAVLDGLTAGGAFKDDSQVIAIGTRKWYANDLAPPGAEISVAEIDEGE